MRKLFEYIVLIICLFGASAQATKYAGEPFSLGVGANALGMGGAVVAGPYNATAGYWNPAGLAFTAPGKQLYTMHSETFGSLLNQDYIGFSSHNGRTTGLTSFGLYLYYLGGGGIKITGFDTDSQYPYVIREENHFDIQFGASLAGRARDNISYGITAKVIYRDIAVETAYGLGLDAGVVYKVDTMITAALAVTDITSTFLAYSNDNTETIYPAVKPGLSIRFARPHVSILLSGQSIIRFEGRKQNAELWQGEISADFQAGMEVAYRGVAFGRVGYDQDRLTAGLGAIINRYVIDLAYLHHNDLDETFRISAGVNF
ncbi:MAG: PorV/PorQ family protein [Candidatus Zixiibacteriota bacterium]